MENISYPIAALGGFVSFVSPCVLPLVPPYLSYLAGVSFEELSSGENPKVTRRAFFTALLFVTGFSTIFVASGAAVTAFGQALRQYSEWLNTIAGIAIIIMGLHFMGVFRIAMLYQEARVQVRRPMGFLGAYVMGLAFAFGWTPCIGPILATILSLAGNEASVARGAGLLAVYSAGLGIPFLLTALLLGPFMSFFKRIRNYYSTIEKVMGALLIITGIAFLSGGITSFSTWLVDEYPWLFEIEKNVLNWFGL